MSRIVSWTVEPGVTIRRRYLLLLLFIAAVVAATLFYLASQSALPFLYISTCFLLIATLFPVWIAVKRGTVDWFEPIYPLAFLYFLYFGAYTIYFVENPVRLGRLANYSTDTLSLAMVYTIFGFTALLLGYYSKLPSRIAKLVAPLRVPTLGINVVPIIYIVYAVGFALRMILVSKGWHIKYASNVTAQEVPAGFNIVDYLTTLCQFGFMLGVIYYYAGTRSPRFNLVLWFILLPLELLFAFLGGIKSSFLPIISVILVGYHYYKRSLSIRHFLIPIILMVFLITPVLTIYRSVDAQELRGKGFAPGLGYALNQIGANLTTYSASEYLQFSYETFMERVNGSGAFSVVIESVPEQMDYQYGKTMFLGFFLLVPTFLWPGKYDFYQNVMVWDERIFGLRGMGGIAITQIGELYLNFHLAGVIIGMFLLGVFYKSVYIYFAKERNPVGLFIYINLWLSIIFIEFPFGAAYANMFKHLTMLLIISWLVNRGRLLGRALPGFKAWSKASQGLEVTKG